MPIPKRWSPLKNIERLPEQPGVYELGDGNKSILKVGSGEDLQRRVRQQLTMSGKTKPKFVRWEETSQPEVIERQHLLRYQESHGGKLPPLNETIPGGRKRKSK
jgi:hypothetical protein